MAENNSFDLVVIGGGPAGYVGAIRAAQLGMNVACVERDRLGGVCLNWGCIPTKALLANAEFYRKLTTEADQWGIEADNVRFDWAKVIGRSRKTSDTLNKGVGFLFKKNKIEHIEGTAKIVAAGGGTSGGGKKCQINIAGESGNVVRTLHATNVLVATGAQPRSLPGVEYDGQTVITSKQAMTLPERPERLIIVGAGAIGMEFAYFYNAFGTQVTVIEMLDRLLPVEDDESSKAIARAYRKQKIDTRTSTKTLAVEKTEGGVAVTVAPVDDESKQEVLHADKVLIAIGVKGNYEGLFDSSVNIETFKDHIKVDKEGQTFATSAAGIYAVGDVIGPPWLAHVASEEAIVCVEKLAGHQPQLIDYTTIPGCTYCQPQVASVGLTERACKEQGIEYSVGQFPFQASGKAQATGHTEGFVKIITDTKYGEILGAHMVGDNVTELIAEMGLARRLEATAEDVIATIHAHPTLSEAVHEATLGTEGRAIHF